MTAGVFIGVWVALGLIVLFTAMRGGPRGARQALHSQSRRGRRASALILGSICLLGGVLVPALVLGFNGAHKDRVGPQGLRLTAFQSRGRAMFAAKCSVCHTLNAAQAVGRVGPNLDQLRPPSALVLDAIANGRARGMGQMPAALLDGPDARAVSSFVAVSAGR
ncbi:MAG TPA: c-type cytochrome [Solirubrobacteraceae bacterium]|jgi:cytochrome c553|nr:c-type cytochrome [Solirubrobacteraceae bacterium]